MVSNIFLSIISPVVVSVLTTIVMIFLKEKREKKIEYLIYSYEGTRLMQSCIVIATVSFILAMFMGLDLYINEIKDFQVYKILFFRSIFSTIMLFVINISYHMKYLKKCIKENKILILMLIVYLLYLWWCIFLIYRLGYNPITKNAFNVGNNLIIFYIMLITFKQYLNLNSTKVLKRIVITTQENEAYHSTDLNLFDNYTVFYDLNTKKRVLLFNSDIKSIEYEYQEKTIGELT